MRLLKLALPAARPHRSPSSRRQHSCPAPGPPAHPPPAEPAAAAGPSPGGAGGGGTSTTEPALPTTAAAAGSAPRWVTSSGAKPFIPGATAAASGIPPRTKLPRRGAAARRGAPPLSACLPSAAAPGCKSALERGQPTLYGKASPRQQPPAEPRHYRSSGGGASRATPLPPSPSVMWRLFSCFLCNNSNLPPRPAGPPARRACRLPRAAPREAQFLPRPARPHRPGDRAAAGARPRHRRVAAVCAAAAASFFRPVPFPSRLEAVPPARERRRRLSPLLKSPVRQLLFSPLPAPPRWLRRGM